MGKVLCWLGLHRWRFVSNYTRVHEQGPRIGGLWRCLRCRHYQFCPYDDEHGFRRLEEAFLKRRAEDGGVWKEFTGDGR